MGLHRVDEPTEACQEHWQTFAGTRPDATATVIARYRDGLEKVQTAELERLLSRLPELNEDSQLEIRQFADRLVAKLLHPPMETLRDESRNDSPPVLLEALQRLFRLNN